MRICRLLLGKTETGTVRLMSGTSTLLPKRGGEPIAAPQIAGAYKIACVAVQSHAMQVTRDAVSDADAESESLADIAIKFAEISNAPLAYAELDLTIIN